MKSLLRILGRIGLILAAALLVVGITSLVNPATVIVGAEGQHAGEGRDLQLPGGLPRSQGGAGMGMGRGRGGEGGHASAGVNLLETSELGSHTAQIALLMLPFAAWSIISRRRRLPALSRRGRRAERDQREARG
jgi:hypothetical protein